MQNVLDFIDKNRTLYIEQLKDFLKYPSISTNPDNKKDVIDCANYLKSHLENIGLNNTRVLPTGGHPVVYADWLGTGNNKPTILIYGHYDVQPVDPLNLWTSPPFEPDIRNNKIYARGSVDDKGQLFLHLKAIEAHLKQNGRLPVNIKLLIEGEEEIGSMNLAPFIEQHKEMLKADVVVISDTSMFDKDMPAISYGLRGLCYMQVEVTGPNRDLHSGGYGGAVDNPINALANIISKLKDDNGKILIDGFYDDVKLLSEKEKAEFAKLPFRDEAFRNDLDVSRLFGENGFSTIERLWARPTLDCNGIWGGFSGEGAKTVLPSKASAKISMRLVPEQNPDKIAKLFEKHIKKIAPDTVKVKVTNLHNAKTAITPIESPFITAAFNALKQAYNKEPYFIREGGSIPVVNTFKGLLGIDSVLLGFGLPGENAHSPDEHFDLDNYQKGIVTSSIFYNELSKLSI